MLVQTVVHGTSVLRRDSVTHVLLSQLGNVFGRKLQHVAQHFIRMVSEQWGRVMWLARQLRSLSE